MSGGPFNMACRSCSAKKSSDVIWKKCVWRRGQHILRQLEFGIHADGIAAESLQGITQMGTDLEVPGGAKMLIQKCKNSVYTIPDGLKSCFLIVR